MLSHKGVALFESIRRTRRCVLVRGSVLLGVDFEVSKAHAKPSVSLSACSSDQNITLSYCSSTMCAAMLPVMLIVD